MKKDVEGVIRKRSLIAKTRKTVFLWVMGASSAVGAAVVVAVMLVQTIVFNAEVIADKNKTLKTLEANIEAVPELEANVRLLNTNKELRTVSLGEGTRPLQSILDALPADDNKLALGASLQQKIFTNTPGLTLEALSVDAESMMQGGGEDSEMVGGNSGVQELAFTATLSGDAEALKRGLQRAERSIRAFNVKSIEATGAGNTVSLQLIGSAYYLPEQNLGITYEERRQK